MRCLYDEAIAQVEAILSHNTTIFSHYDTAYDESIAQVEEYTLVIGLGLGLGLC